MSGAKVVGAMEAVWAVWVVGVVREEVDEDEDSDVELTAEERAEVARIEEECSARWARGGGGGGVGIFD